MSAPQHLTTARLTLRRPTPADASDILASYAADSDVTRYLSWPTHRTAQDTLGFLAFSDDQWNHHGAGPLLVFSNGVLVGSTGLQHESATTVSTGYVLARPAWGKGFATELAQAMVASAFSDAAVFRIEALCHVANTASGRVLEKAGFEKEGTLRRYQAFPNLGVTTPQDVFMFARVR